MRDVRQDQATGLRRLFAKQGLSTLSVAGAGGAGTTAVSLNLAVALARLGHRILLLDRTKGEAPTALGLKARYELAHVLDGDKPLAEVLLRAPEGICVLPAARGLDRVVERGASWRDTLQSLLTTPAQSFDVWLVNGLPPAALGREPSYPEVLLVIAPTAEAITGAYAQMKALSRAHGRRDFRIVVNHARSESAALSTFTSVAETAHRYLSARLDYCGYLPGDEAPAAPARKPRTTLADTHSPRGRAFARLAEAIAGGPLQPRRVGV